MKQLEQVFNAHLGEPALDRKKLEVVKAESTRTNSERTGDFCESHGYALWDHLSIQLARGGERDLFLRRIEVWDEAQQRSLVFLTNHRHFAASTVAAIYRQRWQIELFFKALKQNSASRPSSAPALMPCRFRSGPALIALLLLKYLQLRARFG
jgi:IS4 transposase